MRREDVVRGVWRGALAIASLALLVFVLGATAERLGDWAGDRPTRIVTFLMAWNLALMGLALTAVRLWRRLRGRNGVQRARR